MAGGAHRPPFGPSVTGDGDAPGDGIAPLVRAKRAAAVSVSVCIPARDEAATVGPLVARLRGEPIDSLVDEVLVVDDGSVDATAAVAEAEGARVLRRSGPPGKGRAMADAAVAACGDLLVFLDADVHDFDPRSVTRLLGPLLVGDQRVVLVKGVYRRPLHGVADEGGRVTELLARPLIERLFAHLAFVRQPLAGEMAIRRPALEQLRMEWGYGVEIGMLIDVADRFGPSAISQVDLGERVHRNRPLHQLADQSRQIVAVMLDRAGLADGGMPPPAVG